MSQYALCYMANGYASPEISFFDMMGKELPHNLREVTYYYDDLREEDIEELKPFLEKIGISLFEPGEYFSITEIKNVTMIYPEDQEDTNTCDECGVKLIQVGNKSECPNCGKFY